ncbi:MAG: hypothetical protein J0I77_09360 [Rudaea sp.]|uniref:hypothetical protein n=1 Tax=unclassified Rudaea TaxID=2627037 RepID=UPI001AD4BEEA|nr:MULTISPECIES: hypothetical protein [unclassified Rudaea]MBN8885914.1 hypothetical protein [Rudaea sp.]MBR0346987.1 hypothetical protein [Rudaea sp.]
MTPEEKQEALELVDDLQRPRSGRRIEQAGLQKEIPYILLPYQVRWHKDTSIVRACDKGRRVGFTWGAWAAEASLEAARANGGMDQFYMGYNQSMAAEFIGDCATFASFYNLICSKIDVALEPVVIANEKRDIVRYKIQFASGNKIEALSAMPHNWRGRQGHARIDETGHQPHLNEVLDGALAFRIWGGRISMGGTHNGEDSPWNELLKQIRAGRLKYSLHQVKFSDAIHEGLYKRICLVTRKEWSKDGERDFVAATRGDYRSADVADEELECIPRRGTGVYFSRLLLEKCAVPDVIVVTLTKKAEFVTDQFRLAETQRWIDETLAPIVRALPGRRTVFGQDFGRTGDLSAIVVGQIEPVGSKWRTPVRIELRNIPFDCQTLIVIWLEQNLPLLHHEKFDARGNGQSHAEAALQRRGPGRVECVMLSGKWYDEWFAKYHQAFEDGDILTFGDEDWIADHRSVVLVGGLPRMSDARTKGSDGGDRHGDTAVGGVLMWAAAREEVQPAAGETVEANPNDALPEAMIGRRRAVMFGRGDDRHSRDLRRSRPGPP